jgi:hypothetical protein
MATAAPPRGANPFDDSGVRADTGGVRRYSADERGWAGAGLMDAAGRRPRDGQRVQTRLTRPAARRRMSGMPEDWS